MPLHLNTSTPISPYAICVKCDAGMDYDSQNTGGVGIQITFPDFAHLEPISFSRGSFRGGNIERLELQAIIQGMKAVLDAFEAHRAAFRGIGHIIVLTDRMALNDQGKTNAYRIRDWKRNGWHNDEGKAIKNSDLLDLLDKTRAKLIASTRCKLEISYARSRAIKAAHKLSRAAKRQPPTSSPVQLRGIKRGRRQLEGSEIDYPTVKAGEGYVIRVYNKQAVVDQWAISAEIWRGALIGRKLTIYVDTDLERLLHRGHLYRVTLTRVFRHHVAINEKPEELEDSGRWTVV